MNGHDVTDLILVDHERFRREFLLLWDLRVAGDEEAIAAAWTPLAELLEVHASAEEEIVYPVLLHRGGGDAAAETDDAIGDHNDIRDGIKKASEHTTGSSPWWDAVLECRKANDEHMAEEERDVIPDFRGHTSAGSREQLGRQWVKYGHRHREAAGLDLQDKDPQEYVERNS